MPRFTQVRTDTYEDIQINAGVLLNDFDPAAISISDENIIGATSGGVSFATNPEFTDFGEDIDNVPPNTKQLKRLMSVNPVLSGNFIVLNGKLGKMLIAGAALKEKDEESGGADKITPSLALDLSETGDFNDIWLVGDYSTKNGSTKGGYAAIHVKNALSTGGFNWQSTKDGKGTFSFEFTGHYDIEDIDDQPFELYILHGEAEPAA